jgi:hypothetical protein
MKGSLDLFAPLRASSVLSVSSVVFLRNHHRGHRGHRELPEAARVMTPSEPAYFFSSFFSARRAAFAWRGQTQRSSHSCS